MAKPVSEEELQLKKRARRRLIGAVVLVASVAALLPMVLDPEPKPTSQEINIQIPSPDAKGGFSSRVAPVLTPAAKATGDGNAEAAKAPDAPAVASEAPGAKPLSPDAATETPASKAVAEKAVEKASDKPADKPAEKAPAKAAKATEKAEKVEKAEKSAAPKAGSGNFFIQVIALAEPEKAKAMQQKIIDAGVRSYTEVVAAGNGKVTRVRAGPFATREEAEQARTKLAAAGLEGKVAGQ